VIAKTLFGFDTNQLLWTSLLTQDPSFPVLTKQSASASRFSSVSEFRPTNGSTSTALWIDSRLLKLLPLSHACCWFVIEGTFSGVMMLFLDQSIGLCHRSTFATILEK
jgi:hypothetical protein